jgi:diguanylate cyclase (GGDEF)-like protein
VRPAPWYAILGPILFLVACAALPWAATLGSDAWPRGIGAYRIEILSTIVTVALGVWVLALLRRQHRLAREHVRDLESATLVDPLTGLANRRALERDLESILNRSRRLNHPLALLHLEVDGLRAVNERHGWEAGEATLRTMGAVLRSSARLGTDLAYRSGGDEFVVATVADPPAVELIVRRITRAFHERSPRRSKVSVGVVIWDGRASAHRLLDQAHNHVSRQKHPEPLFSAG